MAIGIFENDTAKFEIETTVLVERKRFEELVRKETQLDFLKKLIESKVSYNNYVDISDLRALLDIKKER